MRHVLIAAGAAVAALVIAACGGSPSPGAGDTTTTQPTAMASSAAAAASPPAGAWHGQVGNTKVTAWCTIIKHTDINGNPLDAWQITYDNKGPYHDALAGVELNFYNSAGNLVGGDGYANSPVPFDLTDGELDPTEVPAGVSTIGTSTVQNLAAGGANEAPSDAATCAIAGFH